MFLPSLLFSKPGMYVILCLSEIFIAVKSTSGVTNRANISLRHTISTFPAVTQILIYPYYFQSVLLRQRRKLSTSHEILHPEYIQHIVL